MALILLLQDLPGTGPITRVAADRAGRTWVGEEAMVILGDDPKPETESIPKLDLEKAFREKNRALRFGRLLLVDAAGRLWLDVEGRRLWSHDGKTWGDRKAAEGATFAGRAVERDGVLWFPDSKGVHRFDGSAWSYATAFESPEPDAGFLLDHEGRAWMWSRSAVFHLEEGRFTAVKNLPAEPVGGICPIGKEMLIVHDRGLFTWPGDETRAAESAPDATLLPRHVENLAAVDAATRSEAEHWIVAIGRDALPALKEAAAKATQELLKKRLERLAAEIEKPVNRRVRIGRFFLLRVSFLWRTRTAAYLVGQREGELGKERVLLRVDAKGVERLSGVEESLDEHLATTLPNAVTHEDGEGVLWLCRYKTGLWRFDGVKLSRVAGTAEDGSYEYLGTDASGATYWRQVYVTKRIVKVAGETATLLKGR